jgi:hypothetical protein
MIFLKSSIQIEFFTTRLQVPIEKTLQNAKSDYNYRYVNVNKEVNS